MTTRTVFYTWRCLLHLILCSVFVPSGHHDVSHLPLHIKKKNAHQNQAGDFLQIEKFLHEIKYNISLSHILFFVVFCLPFCHMLHGVFILNGERSGSLIRRWQFIFNTELTPRNVHRAEGLWFTGGWWNSKINSASNLRIKLFWIWFGGKDPEPNSIF